MLFKNQFGELAAPVHDRGDDDGLDVGRQLGARYLFVSLGEIELRVNAVENDSRKIAELGGFGIQQTYLARIRLGPNLARDPGSIW